MANRNTGRPFSGPPPGGGRYAPDAVEEAAVRAAIRYARVSLTGLYRAAGIGPADRLRFVHLARFAEFPVVPSVTDARPEVPLAMAADFSKSRVYAAWVDADGPAHLVFRGPEWGVGILYPSRDELRRSALVLFDRRGVRFVAETFASWLASTDWDGGQISRGPDRSGGDEFASDPFPT